jgi:hypothetical protein
MNDESYVFCDYNVVISASHRIKQFYRPETSPHMVDIRGNSMHWLDIFSCYTIES